MNESVTTAGYVKTQRTAKESTSKKFDIPDENANIPSNSDRNNNSR